MLISTPTCTDEPAGGWLVNAQNKRKSRRRLQLQQFHRAYASATAPHETAKPTTAGHVAPNRRPPTTRPQSNIGFGCKGPDCTASRLTVTEMTSVLLDESGSYIANASTLKLSELDIYNVDPCGLPRT